MAYEGRRPVWSDSIPSTPAPLDPEPQPRLSGTLDFAAPGQVEQHRRSVAAAKRRVAA